MIYITGDTHGNPIRLHERSFYEQENMTKSDYVIILGDFGIIWANEENEDEKSWLDWLEDRPFTTLFIDGNHDNHVRLATYPVKEFHGGKVHEIRPSVLHMMRGEVFDICNKKIFAFGGASSHDISDGILDYQDENWRDQAKELDEQGKYMYRVKGLSWWEEELPSKEEMINGVKNLEKHDWTVDYIITHSPPASVIALLGHGLYDQDDLTKYLEEIRSRLDFKKHFMGHMHVNQNVNDKDILLYEQIIRIA